MKRLIVLLAILMLLAGCATSGGNSTYSRGPDGSITATNGSVNLVYSSDGKSIVGESFTPGSATGGGSLSLGQLIQFVQSIMGLSNQMAMQAKPYGPPIPQGQVGK